MIRTGSHFNQTLSISIRIGLEMDLEKQMKTTDCIAEALAYGVMTPSVLDTSMSMEI
jgi:hypothetical protein